MNKAIFSIAAFCLLLISQSNTVVSQVSHDSSCNSCITRFTIAWENAPYVGGSLSQTANNIYSPEFKLNFTASGDHSLFNSRNGMNVLLRTTN